MTSEELKEALSMREVVESYGVQIKRDGMCCCPIHGEKNASMKVYKDSFNCFACGANGDIFTFVQLMDNCDFKTAFLTLGGTYERTTKREKNIASLKREKTRKSKESDKKLSDQLRVEMIACFDLIQESLQKDKPLSDKWCLSQNMLPVLSYWWECFMVTGEEVDKLDVYRKCQRFRQNYNS